MQAHYQKPAQTVEKSSRPALHSLLYTPQGYANTTAAYPLILFLHGTGERGSDLDAVRRQGLPKKLDALADFPFVVVAPQCPLESIWVFELDALNALLDQVMADYRIDSKRLYLTGLSLGGSGTWYLAQRFPGKFAAIAPVCGRGTSLSVIQTLRNTPIWAFHGGQDATVPVEESERMVKALQEIGADVRLTIYPELTHDSWTRAYDEPELYDWLLSHRLP